MTDRESREIYQQSHDRQQSWDRGQQWGRTDGNAHNGWRDHDGSSRNGWDRGREATVMPTAATGAVITTMAAGTRPRPQRVEWPE